jgi:hypothetical protein
MVPWKNIKCLVIKGKYVDSKDFEPLSFQNMLLETRNTLECKSIKDDAEYLLNMDGFKGEGDVLEDETLPEVSLETKSLREKLRHTIPHNNFQVGWLILKLRTLGKMEHSL